MINGKLVTTKRGQTIFGLDKFSAKSGVTVNKLRRCISILEKEGMIHRQKTPKFSLISIVNYDEYQSDHRQNTGKTQPNHKQTTSKPQHRNNDNKENNVNKVNNSIVVISDEMPTEREEGVSGYFPTNKNGEWFKVKTDNVKRWIETYPAADVKQELKSMREWLFSNPKRRKTSGGMNKFITNWLKRVQDKGGSINPANSDKQNSLANNQKKSGTSVLNGLINQMENTGNLIEGDYERH